MISIMIPTMNRPEFISRMLNYYADVQYKHWILIADSSNSENLVKIQGIVKQFEDKLKIKYQVCPNYNFAQAIHAMVQVAETPYIAYIADDDFLIPEGMEQCAKFLDNNPEYSAAHGYSVLFALKEEGAFGDMASVSRYRQGDMEYDNPAKRLIKYLSRYFVTIFSLQRKQNWEKNSRIMASMSDGGFGGELTPCSLAVIQGKVKQLECLYLVRQGHDQRYLQPRVYDWITNPHWYPSFQLYHEALKEELILKGLEAEKAEEVVKQALWAYLNRVMISHYSQKYGEGDTTPKNKIKEFFKGIPGLSDYLFPAYKNFRSRVSPEKHMTLSVINNPASTYYKDFEPIIRNVTAQSEETP